MAEKKVSTRIKLGPAVGSYATIFEPRAIDETQEPRYSITLLFDKKTADKQLAELQKMVDFVAVQKFGPKAKELMKQGKIRNPIRDGDTDKPDNSTYAGKVFVGMSTKQRPGIVDRHLQPVTDKSEAYSGCKFVASVNVFAYDRAGNKGVSLGLNNLMVYEKGDRIDGRKGAEEDFAEFVDEGGEPAGNEADFLG